MRNRGGGELDRAPEHERRRAAPVVGVEALEAAGRRPARIRHQDVEPAEVLRARVDDPGRLAFDREVGRQCERPERVRGRAERIGLARTHSDRGALADQLLRDRPSQAAARTADERDATLEAEVQRRR